jgi:HTH-type transcriptional regulator/antitoxin MqsA
MKCPVCGATELIHDTRDLPYPYKGETTVIAAVTGDFCPAYAESILDAAESSRVMREMRAFQAGECGHH